MVMPSVLSAKFQPAWSSTCYLAHIGCQCGMLPKNYPMAKLSTATMANGVSRKVVPDSSCLTSTKLSSGWQRSSSRMAESHGPNGYNKIVGHKRCAIVDTMGIPLRDKD